MSIRSRVFHLFTNAMNKLTTSKVGERVQSSKAYEQTSQFVEDKFHYAKHTATRIGRDVYQQLETKRQTFADSLEKEMDLRNRYRQIEEKLAKDLAELEMRKALLEKEVSGKDRMLFDESYEHARKEIIKRRMQEASTIFYPNSGRKIRDELFSSLVKILRGEKQSESPQADQRL